MFRSRPWAAVFIQLVSGNEEAAAGLEALKVLASCLGEISGMVSGTTAAFQLEKKLRNALTKTGHGNFAVAGSGAEIACRIVFLLVKRGCIGELDNIIEEIIALYNERNRILAVTVDSAFPLDAQQQDVLKKVMAEKWSVQEVKIENRIVPELLGGCVMQVNGELYDYSFRGRLSVMAKDLGVPPAELGRLTAGG
jgi:ATP synthase F1 delta subunit